MKLIVILFFISFAISCRNEHSTKKEFYNSGELKSEIHYLGAVKNGEAKSYYKSGVVKERFFYKNDTLQGEYYSYNQAGQINSKGFFFRGKAVGPTYYYYLGNLISYNERDFNQDIYYVKKFDSTGKILLKEEGVCISPNIILSKSTNSKYSVIIFAFPDEFPAKAFPNIALVEGNSSNDYRGSVSLFILLSCLFTHQ